MRKPNKRISLNYVNIIQALEDANVGYKRSGKNIGNNWIGVVCPFCGDSRNHCGINLHSPVFSCFVCGNSGNLIKFFSQVLGSFHTALELLQRNTPRELVKF